jgi:hypothetical protein
MTQILASAVVDVIEPSTPKKVGQFKVTVWGKPPHDETRVYEIMAKNDTIAAQQGIARFVREMEGN